MRMRTRKHTRKYARKPNVRRPNHLATVRNLVAIAVVFQVMQAAFASPRLSVRSVHVSGASRLPAERLVDLAAVPAGGNIFRVNLYRTRQSVLREPIVRDATVTRVLPDTILIRVEERSPRLTARTADGLWEVDDHGVAFRERDSPVDGLPILELPANESIALGSAVSAERWQPARECLEIAARHRIPLRTIAFDAQGELWLNIAIPPRESGKERLLPVRLGRPEELAQKLAQIQWVLPVAVEDGQHLDLMCVGRAAYRKSGEAQGSSGTVYPSFPAPSNGLLEHGRVGVLGSPDRPDRNTQPLQDSITPTLQSNSLDR